MAERTLKAPAPQSLSLLLQALASLVVVRLLKDGVEAVQSSSSVAPVADAAAVRRSADGEYEEAVVDLPRKDRLKWEAVGVGIEVLGE